MFAHPRICRLIQGQVKSSAHNYCHTVYRGLEIDFNAPNVIFFSNKTRRLLPHGLNRLTFCKCNKKNRYRALEVRVYFSCYRHVKSRRNFAYLECLQNFNWVRQYGSKQSSSVFFRLSRFQTFRDDIGFETIYSFFFCQHFIERCAPFKYDRSTSSVRQNKTRTVLYLEYNSKFFFFFL